MAVLTVPLSQEHQEFIQSMVKSGRAANKAHAVRLAITLLAEEEASRRIAKARKEIAEGKALKGDLKMLARLVD